MLNSLPPVSSLPGGTQIPGLTLGDQNSVTDPVQGGSFTAPFRAPGPACKNEEEGSPAPSTVLKDFSKCPPAGVSVTVMPNGQILYFDGLEAGGERQYWSIVAEFGDQAVNDQSRLLTLNLQDRFSSAWRTPKNSDGGANGSTQSEYLLPHMPGILGQIFNDQGQGRGLCPALTR